MIKFFFVTIVVWGVTGCKNVTSDNGSDGKNVNWNDDGLMFGNPINVNYEEMAGYPEGADACKKFIYDNLKYPPMALQDKISGIVIVTFTINEEGLGNDYQVARGVHPLLDKEALRVVKLISKWKPSKRVNIYTGEIVPVKCKYALPVIFELP